MSYFVLARKYRPQNFESIIGQEHITDLMKGAISSGRIAHAYLFCGPRGVGKTSCARILAKCLNCQNGPTLNPCDQCFACQEITKGTSMDVLEIDGASNRGIDEIRSLRENVKFAPGYGRYKVYIVDEVHMLTTEAFNALLKTLEEPPEHVKFIFATTDPNKVPATIISRCQRYDFKRPTLKVIAETLSGVAVKENLKIEVDALHAIAKASQGSFRDALSILDQVSALQDREIKTEDVCSMLGLVEVDLLFQLVDALGKKDCSTGLKILDDILDKGKDVKQLIKDMVEHFRNLMVVKVGGKSLGRLIDQPVSIKEMYLTQSQDWDLADILKAIDFLIGAQEMGRIVESLRMPLEIAFAKMTYSSSPLPAAVYVEKKDVVVKEPSPVSESMAASFASPKKVLKSSKGETSFFSNPNPALTQAPVTAPVASPSSFTSTSSVRMDLALEDIRKSWSGLTHAVSREKMSLATYLQDGFPVSLDGEKLKIGFTRDFTFHKESLEDQESRILVEKVFSEKLQSKIVVQYVLADEKAAATADDEEGIVKTALDTFKGTVVRKWHNE
ncbi:MAG: DNA polymerase III subunit gamma/tau [Candidatus Omnitrophica bacterium]|nr:DNA polymerase III subunit gamma/tau [Candidatus Omnitrophota bacterium]